MHIKQDRVALKMLCNVNATEHLMSYQPISRKGLYNTPELCVNLYHLKAINFYLPRLVSDYEGALSSSLTTPPTNQARAGTRPSPIIYINLMVGKRGFEPRTPASRTLCSTRLSHFPKPRSIYRKESLSKSSTFALYRFLFSKVIKSSRITR